MWKVIRFEYGAGSQIHNLSSLYQESSPMITGPGAPVLTVINFT